MNSLAAMLLNIIFCMDQNTSLEYLASFFLAHYLQIPDLSQQDVLKKAHISPATLKKFCAHLGFDSYKDMKNYACASIKMRGEQYKERYAQTSIPKMLKNIQGIADKEIDTQVFLSSLEKAAEYIQEASEILWIGALFPLALSMDFAEDLVMAGKPVIYNQISNAYQVQPFKKDAVIILPTLTGLFVPENMPGFTERIQNTPVILLSQKYLKMPKISRCHLIKMPDLDQSNQSNLLLLETYNLLKYIYYSKYVFKV